MMNKKHLEKLLAINGVSTESSDEEIKQLLLSARYTNDEVLIALQVLRQEAGAVPGAVSELNKVFRSDSVLNSGEVSRLLGVEMGSAHNGQAQTPGRRSMLLTYALVTVVATLVALGGIIYVMYSLEFGIFHTTSAMQL